MRPKDLNMPTDGVITVDDSVWTVPDRVGEDPFEFQGFSSFQFFDNEQPVYLEYCSGNGLWISSRAKQDPSINWVGVEIKWKRIKKIWAKIKNMALNNLFAVCAEGLELTRRFLQDGSIDKVFINFPDPWPKRRHAKYRIVSPIFVKEVHRILKSDGEFLFVTDDADYAQLTITTLLESGCFTPVDPHPHFITHLDGYGSSSFEELWRQKEKQIHYIRFIKLT